ncbi:MAG: HAMP domain-containing histidine kinase [Acidobacteriota bacterium]|nr:HAMP domain-containing histidine kinase [Acidobacteriota bacterium]
MKHSWIPILFAAGLFGLLALLATLQYSWLGQISESEKEQMQKRLQNDSEHFAEGFNRTVQSAYFPFQLFANDWQKDFVVDYQNWRKRAEYPDLLKDFYYVPKEGETLQYNFEYYQFLPTDFKADFEQIKTNFAPVDGKNLILRMPIYMQTEKLVETTFVGKTMTADSPVVIPRDLKIPRRINLSDPVGYLLIKLDENVLKEKVLKDLSDKYFADGSYRISIVSQADNSTVFQTQAIETSDLSVKFFALTPDNLAVFVNQNLLSSLDYAKGEINFNRQFNRRFENRVMRIPRGNSNANFKVAVASNDKSQVLQMNDLQNDGIWLLNAQHTAGSLENFVAAARHKSLAVSFGILSLLAASVILIFVSAQRAKRLAQKQMDFVSAVSHEFRTPLAVIYSAGENLTDGVVNNEVQVSQYGNLIKREGKKLSQMVEQILEFAGARSGNRKYDLRQTDIKEIIEVALSECKSLMEEKDFSIDKDIAENLRNVIADKTALSQAIQNLIANSIKYGNGNKWLKITAQNGDGRIKITVEDRGIGIASKDLKHIFEPFFRSKRVIDEQIHGNGLGLSLVKQTVEAHGGKIEAESEIGKGSRFTIHIPLNIEHLSSVKSSGKR